MSDAQFSARKKSSTKDQRYTTSIRLRESQVLQAIKEYAEKHYVIARVTVTRENISMNQYDPDYEIVAYLDVEVEPLKPIEWSSKGPAPQQTLHSPT